VDCILFSEDGYFIEGDVARAPPEGWRIVVHNGEDDESDVDGEGTNES
jgi:hypothetical protein